MKNLIFNSIRNILLVAALTISFNSLAQAPPPPPGGAGGASNTGNNSNGGSAPIGGGLFILLGLGAAYGGKKIYQFYKEGEETLED
ncbi:MAG: hypothetical protein KJ578_10430 [Bacteroidetes bacterium]|nr:hypothetical protein [Bacteroidota bacterium]MBU1578673.1 hypothetical protein [Bacteroidota bacterium]MBU2466404.1 hypothetical protein [Bacteroidota bacterium]MBU2558182.1 hypothetical protein [Bacteroidota bacterium]